MSNLILVGESNPYGDDPREIFAEMHARIRELEEIDASAEFLLDVAWDEIEEGRQRERWWIWTVIGFATVAMVAIMRASWLAMGR